MISKELYTKATEEIEKAHSADPTKEPENGQAYPAEFLYGRRMLKILDMIIPDSSYTLKLAAQFQHFKRWSIPRGSYPYDKRGYHQWRRVVMEYQLQETHKLLSEIHMGDVDRNTIINALKNQGDKSNVDAQILVDTSCLVFIKWYMEGFAVKHESDKVQDIMKKTMRKMTENGRNLIAKLDIPVSSMEILEKSFN